MSSLKDLAIIIPIAPNEKTWSELLPDLQGLPSETEIILVGPQKPSQLNTGNQIQLPESSFVALDRAINVDKVAHSKKGWVR